MPKPKLHRIYSLLLTFTLFIIIYLIGRLIPEPAIRSFINATGPFGPLVLGLLLLVTYIIAPLSGSPFLFVGFYSYGLEIVYLTTVVTLISSLINFHIARRWGRDLVKKLATYEGMKKVDKLTENYGLATLFFLRVLEGGISDFVSYSAGLTNLKFKPYFMISTLGILINSFIWYQFASKVNNPLNFTLLNLVITVSLSLIFFLGALIVNRIKKSPS